MLCAIYFWLIHALSKCQPCACKSVQLFLSSNHHHTVVIGFRSVFANTSSSVLSSSVLACSSAAASSSLLISVPSGPIVLWQACGTHQGELGPGCKPCWCGWRGWRRHELHEHPPHAAHERDPGGAVIYHAARALAGRAGHISRRSAVAPSTHAGTLLLKRLATARRTPSTLAEHARAASTGDATDMSGSACALG